MTAIATLRNLDFTWPGSSETVLENISWTIEAGVHCALIGENGSGKSSLLGLLAGINWPCRGEIFWHGKNGPEYSRIYGRSIASLISPRIQENIQRQTLAATFEDALMGAFADSPFAFAADENDENDHARRDMAHDAASRLHCENLLKLPLACLSQGQLRILLCARALLRKPRLCLLDEALDGLDRKRRQAFLAALMQLAPDCAIIMATHREDAIPEFCTERRYLAGKKLLKKRPAAAAAPKKCQTAPLMQIPDKNNNGILLKLENVSVYIDRIPVLRNITWQTRVSEHWRIDGENGSGKSTLLRLLAGEEQAACDGLIKRRLPGAERELCGLEDIRAHIHIVSDVHQALYGYDVNGLELVLSGYEQSAGLYREYSCAEQDAAIAAIGHFFNAACAAQIAAASIRKLSSGQLRRLYLARALLRRPAILLLDEAATGLDAANRREWFSLLASLADKMQIIMVSHHDEDVPAFVNRCARLENGRLVAC